MPARAAALAFALCSASAALAGPLTPAQVPDDLRPWIDWALHGHEAERCTFLHGGEARTCAWPAELELRLEARGGSFSARWLAEREEWVPLPGDGRAWPAEVRVDGGAAPAIERGGRPAVRLASGTHVISGRFAWSRLPAALAVPPGTGLLRLTLDGRPIDFPVRDDEGRVLLATPPEARAAEERLAVHVLRKVTDDQPLVVTTLIELEVSGARREERLGAALLPGFVPFALESTLPARLDPDGRLRVQVRPGHHRLTLTARHDRPVDELGPSEPGGPWATGEVWVFEARPRLRLVDVHGPPAVDPQQTRLPEEWKSLPAWRLTAGERLKLVERRRGDAEPEPDRLTLERELWLDFDGRGLTARDTLGGTLSRGTRLEVAGPAVLGRATVDGQDALITRLSGGRAGVELARREVAVVAVSRIDGRRLSLPAAGWDHDFQHVSATLHLPPGFRLVAARGVDDAPRTWLRAWSLFDLFLALITAIAVGRLWGTAWGLLALVAVGLTYPEAGAPRGVWLATLAAEALRRLLPPGRIRALALTARAVALIVAVLVIVPFAIGEARRGLHPVLERPWQTLGGEEPLAGASGRVAELQAEVKTAPQAPPPPPPPGWSKASVAEIAIDRADRYLARDDSSVSQIQRFDPDALVQTGPGLPGWTWEAAPLEWSGPVRRGERLTLWIAGPRLGLVLALARVLLTTALALRLLAPEGRPWPGWLAGRPAAAALVALALATPSAASAEVPPPEVLEQLRARLLAPPDCHPACASAGRMLLEAEGQALTLRLEIDVAARTAVPLPGNARHWLPATVLVDGRAAAALARSGDGRLWLALDPGRHEAALAGPLPARAAVQLSLPLRPRRVDVRARGFAVSGVRDDGSAEETLELVREAAGGGDGSTGGLEAQNLPAFVRVERELRLGLAWTLATRVARVSPTGTAVSLEVPLLAGESPTSPDLRVASGKAIVTLGPQAGETAWESVLEPRPRVELVAPEAAAWAETWRVVRSPLWHVTHEGIPPVHGTPDTVIEWRPWPGEQAAIAVARPEGVAGPTLTIESSRLDLAPGQRALDAALALVVRTSRGADLTLVLPEGAETSSLSVRGEPRPYRQEGRKLVVSLAPGESRVETAWREARGMGVGWRTSEVGLGVPSTNASIRLTAPLGRWVLFAAGPRVGPAVLFWPYLLVVALAAAILSRAGRTPLGLLDWILLGLGLTQAPFWVALLVAGWLLALGWRRERDLGSPFVFDLRQLALAAWTAAALAGLLTSIKQGLLGLPDMQIAGNGSAWPALNWFADRAGEILPRAWIVSVPIFFYRLAMLLWALWIARALLRWLVWAWQCFTAGGMWRPLRRPRPAGEVRPAG